MATPVDHDNEDQSSDSGLLGEITQQNQKIFRQILRGIIPILIRRDVSSQIKTYCIVIIILIISILGIFTILIANVITKMAKIEGINFGYYLASICFVLSSLLLALVITSSSARKYEANRDLEMRFDAITESRKRRHPRHGATKVAA